MHAQSGPRIYNLFPLLAGNCRDWCSHLDRIAEMEFNWIYLNPFHYPGFSGSLYAVKDYYRLNPLFDDGSGDPDDEQLRRFTSAARVRGLSVMMDLVINHTARDSLLVESHPDWFHRDVNGELVAPRAVDPDDPALVTVWEDLAALDFSDREGRQDSVRYFQDVVRHYVGLGFAGFRCDAAYQVPIDVWQLVIAAAREVEPTTVFMAETLGCRLEEVQALAPVDFDYLFNSAKWWDFQSPWLLEQYGAFRHIAPSIAFPESHDTPRLVDELLARGISGADIEAHSRFHYIFAAVFSCGVMMPMGYEFGYRRPLNVVATRPENAESPLFDISDAIAAINRMKAAVPALNEEGPQASVGPPQSALVALRRETVDRADWALLLINPMAQRAVRFSAAELELAPTGGMIAGEVTPGGEELSLEAASRVLVNPLEVRVFSAAGVTPQEPATSPLSHTVNASMAHEVSTQTIVIENVRPQVDCGKYPVKRVVGDSFEVTATIYREGHDRLSAMLVYRRRGQRDWKETPMAQINPGLDLWHASIRLEQNTTYQYTIEAWTDYFETWRDETGKKLEAGQGVAVELLEGRELVSAALDRSRGTDYAWIEQTLAEFDASSDEAQRADLLRSPLLRTVISRWPDRSAAVRYEQCLAVTVDRLRARYASWYEMFPRSQGSDPARSATFDECQQRLPYIRGMGFDVVYLPPIHPIGRVNRKGANNTLKSGPGDPGSPYAIGSIEGGHTAVHPDLGTLDDFRRFLRAVEDYGMEVALDFAIQCAPDHPWVREHPEWFSVRPDGSIKYAENPPKKYQDIVNVNFYGEHQDALWRELRDIILFWVEQGVRIFRVDNPHTKPASFWEWMIADIRNRHPDVIFLSEAFTRPPMLHLLAKIGFQQSYTYFTWRNDKHELIDYLTELTAQEGREYLRPNFFPTTPDILPAFLQSGQRSAFKIRLVLAATLSSVYGMYSGYELCESQAVPGKEEYFASEKYQFKVWDWDRPGNIRDYVTAINRIRHDNPALHELINLRFHHAENDHVLFYGKTVEHPDNLIFVAVNLDPFEAHGATLHFPLEQLEIPGDATYEVQELLTGHWHLWHGRAQHVYLEPDEPAMIFRITPWRRIDYRTPSF